MSGRNVFRTYCFRGDINQLGDIIGVEGAMLGRRQGLILFFPLQVVGRDPALAGMQAVLHLAVPPPVGISLKNLQAGALGETHSFLVAVVVGNGHIDIPAQVVVDELALVNGFGTDRRHRYAIALASSAQSFLDVTSTESATRRCQVGAFGGPCLALDDDVRPHSAEGGIPTDAERSGTRTIVITPAKGLIPPQ